MATRAAVALLMATTMAAAGCSTTGRLHLAPGEVQYLDGLGPEHAVEVQTTEGPTVVITANTTLRFAGPGIAARKVRCERIEIDGSLLTCVSRAGIEEHVDLARTPSAFLLVRKGRSWGRIALYALGAYLVIGIVACAVGGCGD